MSTTRRWIIAAAMLAVLCAPGGCVQPVGNPMSAWTPRAKLLAARQTFESTVNVVAVLREQGSFTADEAATIRAVISIGENILDRWEAMVLAGQPVPVGAIKEYNAVVLELRAAQVKVQRERS